MIKHCFTKADVFNVSFRNFKIMGLYLIKLCLIDQSLIAQAQQACRCYEFRSALY